jgi:tetratricopeptide (TPR) repeat protein
LRSVVEPLGGRFALLADGSGVATLSGDGTATDLAARAARCALAMRAVVPHASIGLATGRGRVADRVPVGDVIDRATRTARKTAAMSRGDQRYVEGAPIQLDDVTSALLDGRFDVSVTPEPVLRGERDPGEGTRTLLGRATPCVGRDRELYALEAIFDECVSEPVCRAVLVTAAAGVGKSRLRQEFIWRLRQRASREGGGGRAIAPGNHVEIWSSRGDPMRAGSPFGMIAPALRRAAGVRDGEPIDTRRQKLAARIARYVPERDRSRVAEFIGELASIPFPDDQSIQLRAARNDAVLMGDQMRRAWEDLLAAECAHHPVLLVLEDLHWGDLPSVRLVDAALRNLRDRSLMVLALARPEVHSLFPMLWADRAAQEIRLSELTPKACERLIRVTLGENVTAELIDRIIVQATGNAFYLEELIRAVADGKGDALPETVLAMVHARLERLSPDQRRTLRAASVYGRVFWQGGVRSLLGATDKTVEIADWLSDLVDREFVAPRADARFPHEVEYIFRHTLVREASYAMLTDDDRALGHRLAAEWLERAGETEAIVLAEHFERGGEPQRAVTWYQRAAEQALEGNDFDAVVARAERGALCGAAAHDLGFLRLLQAEAHRWRGDPPRAGETGLSAMERLPSGSAAWFSAAAHVANAWGLLGRYPEIEALARELCAQSAQADALRPQVVAVAHATGRLFFGGRYEICDELLGWLKARASEAPDDPTVTAWVHRALAIHAQVRADMGARLTLWRKAAECFERIGDLRNACMQRTNLGESYADVGAFPEAEIMLQAALSEAEHMGIGALVATAQQQLGSVLAARGRLDEARDAETDSVARLTGVGSPRMEGMSRLRLAQILLQMNEIAHAEREALAAVEILAVAPPARPHAMATLARVRLAQGRAGDALSCARDAMSLLVSLGHVDEGESLVRLVYAEALDAAGERDAAASAIREARERLLARAETIIEPGWRQSFLERVPEHARTLELFAKWTQ